MPIKPGDKETLMEKMFDPVFFRKFRKNPLKAIKDAEVVATKEEIEMARLLALNDTGMPPHVRLTRMGRAAPYNVSVRPKKE